ncbi:hypothetical protein QRX60_43295 [Amycolatopsis mongoliensis]|uniref:DUF3558 domain-containing protein n=1 Tax=Amycolatopsis mongoliensis TaxID=715475 RepID=A0A9Y2NIJ3_9PSEU|nr:hypothetical protein [Amycolatopsis sp. 4-36]WIY00813.1 hypothetical protein QRX60_43295 [Amycolatopsis sp. 4-36]
MRRLPAVSGILLLLVAATACGRAEPGSGDASALCSPGYEPRELVDRPLQPALPSIPGRIPTGDQPAETRTTDAAAIKKIAAAACSLPTPPPDIACTLELGPSYELRFLDTQGRTTTLTAASFGCQFVEGLGSRRYDAKPLWEALAAAGLPAPRPR